MFKSLRSLLEAQLIYFVGSLEVLFPPDIWGINPIFIQSHPKAGEFMNAHH